MDANSISAADTKAFNVGPSNSSNGGPEKSRDETNIPPLNCDPLLPYYDMTGNKILVIFNHYMYKTASCFSSPLPTRDGTSEDVRAIKKTFEKFDFNIVTHTDLEHKAILDIMRILASEDHSRTSCLVVIILTHGDRGGKVHAADKSYYLKDLLNIIESGDIGLVNKPKLFFVQACRGGKIDDGRYVTQDDGIELNTILVPSHIDFLVMHPAVDDYTSWRQNKGSWMIQELCEAINKHYDSMDLMQLITHTNRMVAYKRASYTPRDMTTHNKKQTLETRFTLTKIVRFGKRFEDPNIS